MNKRHIHNHGFKLTLTVLLTALLMAGHVSAQVTVKGNVYGGGNLANVQGAVEVNIKGGQIGDVTIDADHGNVYGGGALANTNTDNWDNSTLTDDPYISITITEETDLTGYYTRTGAAAPYTYTPATGTASTGTYYKRRETKVNLTGGTIKGDAYGGGLGRLADPEHGIEAKIATEYGDVLVTVAGTQMVTGTNHGRVFGANNINGTPKGHVKVLVQKTTAVDGQSIDVAAVFGGGNQAAYDPYSATEKAEVEINKTSGEGISLIVGNVFGGGNEAGTENTAGTEVKIMAGNVKTGVYGGCNTSGTVSGDTKVAITGGTIGTAWENAPATFPTLVFGGGLGHETLVNGSVTVELGAMTAAVAPATTPTISGDAIIWGDVYGGSAEGLVNATGSGSEYSATADKTTSVVFYSGTLNGNLYGGGLGTATHAADVYGDITVNIGTGEVKEGVMTTYGNATINGSVFGCNNTNGTPKGDVLVNVYKTAHISSTGDDNNQYQYDTEVDVEDLDLDVESEKRYAIQAVYGGGNLANYTPVELEGSDRHSTTVHVYVCEENTVKAVYGGGNAADVGTGAISANTNVIIEGGRFYNVFGGGNGAGDDNPGANIYGTAKTEIKGGLFNQIFGGSDTKGNVGVVDLTIESESGCLLKVNESFGGANMSDLTGDVITTLTCSDNITIGTFYGGSNQADITGNVTLNVYGGHFENVFGGSKGKTVAENATNDEKEDASADISGNVTLNLYGGIITEDAYGGSNINGRIGGKITVNVLNNVVGCPLDIRGNIYGAGNVTPYSPTYTPDSGTEHISPVVNLIHGTVANVFGGAKGSTATVTASPQVNIGYDATTMGDLTTSETLLYNITRDVTNYTSTTAPADFVAEVTGNVYGGGDLAQVTGNTVVNLRKANSSVDYIFGGGNLANVSGNTTVNIINGTVNHDVYGGGALADVGTDGNDATQVTITGGTVSGSIYGGGLGQVAADAVPDDPATTDVDEARPAVSAIAALVNGAVTVTVNGGTVTDVFGCNNINGAPQSTVTVNINNNVAGNVYGGGNLAAYGGTPTVNILAGTVTGNVYGGGNNAGVGGSLVAMSDGTVLGAVYGGCNTSGTVVGTSTVTVTGGTLGTAFASAPASMDAIPNVLFGGGKGANTSVSGTTTLNVGTKSGSTYTGTANIYGNVYGGSENGTIGDVDVNLYANKIYGNVFGGGYDTDASLAPEGTLAKHAPAAGIVNVLLDGTDFDRSTYNNNAYMAQVFGCNNKNGTPTGLVTVRVKRTIGCDKSNSNTAIADRNVYDVYAVYGGGNMADYVPSGATDSTYVLIEGCDLTSIQYVYGGGNAAAVPASGVSIKGTYIIYNVFGGGNGAGQVPGPNNTLIGNPGANVGYYIDGEDKISYGRGTAVTKLYGGTINEVYGGSNTLGDVRKVIVETKTPEGSTPDCCATLNVINVYGAGSEAEMTGDVSIIMECMPEDYVEAVYGGAKNAVINGNVMLVVTSGKYGRVFGGNNAGGSINGTISVVAKEEGCKPLEIGELYGGGNQAPYSKYGCEKVGDNWVPNTSGKDHTIPEGGTQPARYAIDVLVESCTSIGKVFGGGNEAEVIGDTHVEINMFRGTTDDAPNTLRNLGRIGQVFGGGNLAKVTGKTTVDIGTDGEQEENGSVPEGQKKGVNISSSDQFINPDANSRISLTAGIYGGGNAADVVGDTEVNIGTAYQSLGINITGDIFGGGLGETTTVTGNVTVNIGANTGTNYVGYANITGDVYGGSAKGKVNATKGGTAPDVTYTASSGAATQVNFYGGTITGNLYGGGEGQRAAAGPPAVEAISADVYGPVTVTMEKGSTTNTVVNNVFGCNNFYGAPQNTVNVYINGGTVNHSVYGGGDEAEYTAPTGHENYPAVYINNGTVTENVFGGGLGSTATVTGNPHVTIGDNGEGHVVNILKSVYGGGSLATVDGSTNIVVNGGTIGTDGEGGATYGNIYGGGFGSSDDVRIGLVKGNTEVTVNGGTILHNIYGGGAYGSVGTYTYASSNANAAISALATANTGKATITILGGTIGTDGDENGMIFGSSRGDIDAPDAIQDNMAWVHDTEVIIGTSGQGSDAPQPQIKGSVYGGGENGHTYNNASVTIHSGRIGIDEGTPVTIDAVEYSGANFPYRGNVYGGGCGTDKYYSNPAGVPNPHDGKGDTYNQMAGIVRGTTTVLIDGGQVVRNVYGAGAMGSVGTIDNTGAIVSGGSTSITISGGTIGVDGDDNGNVFGAARGNPTTTQQKSVALVKTTDVIISGTADVRGNVYGGGEIGNVGTYTTSADGTNTYPEGSGVCAVTVSGGTVLGNVFGAGKGIADSFTSERAMVNSTSVTISNGSVEHNVYGGGEIGRVENNTVVAISAGEIKGSVFGAGQGVTTHGYSGLVRGNSTVTIEGTAKVRQNVYGGGETATVGKYWVNGVNYDGVDDVPDPPTGWPSDMPYATRAGGVCTVTIQGSAQVGPDAGASETVGHVFGAGKGVVPSYSSGVSKRMKSSGWVTFENQDEYLQFLETLALVSVANVTIGGNATVKGNVYGGSESGFVQDNTHVQVQGGTIGSTTYGNVYGGGKGLESFAEAGKVKGATNVTISGGTTNGNVYGGGELGYVQQNVTVNVTGGTVVNDVYGGGALADTNTDNWDATKAGVKYVNDTGLTVDTEHPENSSSVTGYYEYNHITGQYSVTSDEKAQANKIYYRQQNITGTWADGKNEANSTTYKTSVSVTGGTVGNVYGGGLGRLGDVPIAAKVYGDVEVTINKEDGTGTAVFTKLKEATNVDVNKTGRVFGCNNLNGTPKGNVTVTVWGTNPLSGVKEERDEELYDVQAVYGGGNMAEYIPVAGKKVQVNIHGCNTTSIEYVFGGGNAAIVPNTDVVICGCWEIGTVFGGGNGSEPIWDYSSSPGRWIDNSGANVPGTARVTLLGGYIHSAFGGSYERGFCGATVLEKPSGNSGRCGHDDCRLQVTDVYGGGQKADTGIINLTISGCTYDDEVTNVYAASYNARVLGDVTLNIWGGKFENVFGGNKDSGLINGKITINIEEVLDETCTNNKPIEIKNLYGGCNAAPYPGPIRTNLDKEGDPAPITDPKITINVISCTSIGNIYGGSLQAEVDGDTEININMIKGYWAGKTYNDRPIPDALGAIGNVFGGGNRGQVNGKTVVNIGSSSTVHIRKRNAAGKLVDDDNNEIYADVNVFNNGKSLEDVVYEDKTVLGANITGDVYGGGNVADVTGNTYVNICSNMQPVLDGESKPTGAYTYTPVAEGTAGVKIGGSVYGGGCEADAKSNTFVTMSGGYVFDGVYGGGLKGSVGTFTRTTTNLPLGIADHVSHTGCVGGKPDVWTAGTGKCTVLVNGGQVGPVEVVLENGGMKNTAGHFIKTGDDNEPVDYGFVFGAGRGAVESDDDPDAHFHTYVKETDVTIGGTAFILGSVYGGGENGRVKGNTLVKIQGGQIGCGEGKTETVNGVLKPKRYAEDDFIDPTTASAAEIEAKAATMTECPHWEYTSPYYPHDPYGTGETDASLIGTDGHTYYGNVFGGGSGYYPYKKANGSHDWLRSAGLVEGNTEVQITGGHILTNVYGGNEMTDVLGTCTVTMSGGTLGVPRTLAQIAAHPVTCYLFGAGKGDQRVHFNKWTNVGDVNVTVSGGIIYGSVFGGGEDGHVGCDQDGNHISGHGNVTMTISGGAKIGTWGTSYVDGNVFGGGRGFSGEALTAGNVSGNVNLTISGGTMLGSIYGGGRLASVGYDLRNVNESGYGEMAEGNRGHITINITGGTIGNDYENIIPSGSDIKNWTNDQWQTWKNTNHIPQTEFVYDNNLNLYRLSHTKGGNVFAGGMGRLYALNGSPLEYWFKLGKVKSTKLTISGTAVIKGNVYGGGEIGWTDGYHISADSRDVSTEILISNGTIIGREITDGSGTTGTVKYTFGSVFGGGYGDATEKLTKELTNETTWSSYPKFQAGRVVGSTQVKMTGGTVLASIYGGGEVANVGYGFYSYKEDQSTNEEPRFTLDEAGIAKVSTYVDVTGGTIGHDKVSDTYFGGATMGNVYGGGSGNRTIVRCGLVLGNTNVNISGSPTIYHNVYGGGSYGTVGDFDYESTVEDPNFPNIVKVSSVEGIYTTGTGIANVTITGGTFGIDGHNNGMVFGSSRGDVTDPAPRDDYMAWVYDTHVTIGDGTNTPQINGSVYGSGENGHTFNNTYVTVHSGTIGISSGSPVTETVNGVSAEYSGANHPYRGNVYGSGCGTDKYDSDNNTTLDMYKPLAGIVLGNTNITIDGGKVVHNVYGGGSMGSVGKVGDDGKTIVSDTETATIGKATITISGGQIGENGTGNGNVFGAARGDEAFTTDGYAQVKTTEVNINTGAVVNGNVFGGGEAGVAQVDTHVNMSGGTVAQNVYGGGYLGNIGVIDKTDINNYKWANQVDDTSKKTGICNVTVTGGKVGPDNNANPAIGNVFGAGKGSGATFQCENAMTYDANVTVSNGTVNGNVYGGGEVGRVENNTTVNIGAGTGEGSFAPDIKGDVFGGGKGLETHGYSALVRGNTEVTVQGSATIAKNVYGGGEIASVGRYGLNAQKMPNILLAGGECKVTVQGSAVIGPVSASDHEGNVFGGGKGVETAYNNIPNDPNRSKRMVTYDPTREVNPHIEGNKGTFWDPSDDPRFVWEYFTSEPAYTSYLETLALTTAPDVTIDGNATINGSVFGGGELGLTKGSVTVTVKGGTIEKDVYGGGALANTNTVHVVGKKDSDGNLLPPNAQGEYEIDDVHPTTNVYLQGGYIKGDAYGGGLGQLEVKEGETVIQEAIEAKTFGEINVYLGGDKNGPSASATHFYLTNYTGEHASVVKSGRIFGCNNLNGSPQENVTVTVWKTVTAKNAEGVDIQRTEQAARDHNVEIMKADAVNYASNPEYVHPKYNLNAVYGGGNLAHFVPDTKDVKTANVVIYGCDDTSIEMVYGGGNAADVPETSVKIWSCYEIGSVYGGGNGKDQYTTDGGTTWVVNPGANVNGDGNNGTLDGDKWIDSTPGNATTWLYGGTVYMAYGGSNEKGDVTGSVFIDLGDAKAAGSLETTTCPLNVVKIVGAGKNADVGDLKVIMGCKPSDYVALLFAGADNANVKGDVELTLTSGNFGKVFGGNNLGGAILGHIQLNIEETGDCATPLTIEELYLGGNQAAYSAYGYYVKTTTSEDGGGVGATTETPELKDDKLQLMPRQSADDPHLAVKTFDKVAKTWTVYTGVGDDKFTIDAHPELNIISCTSIGQVYGGGLGARADMYANPTVNINMIPGAHANKLGGPHKLGAVGAGYTDMQNIEHEGGVFGGGNEATVHGNTTVNIGTATTVNVKSWIHNGDDTYTAQDRPVEGANIVSNVYGGGNLANVTGNTYVNVCAVKEDDLATTDVIEYKGVSITGTGNNGVTIKGNVFGGGKGTADSFKCAKAMVGKVDTNDGKTVITKESIDKGTRVNIGNGTIEGTVYGGGEIGRVEWNSVVTVGLPVTSGTSAPVITGDVYGAGKGVEQYGYAALVRGNTFVTVQADAKVGLSVYGGGEISSVGKYNIVSAENMADPTFTAAHPELEEGMPWSLANSGSGYCNVIVRGNAEIGPDDMKMTADGGPDDFGHVFGAGRGILPYENETLFECKIHPGQKHPGRMAPPDGDHPDGVWECFYDTESGKVDEDAYLTFIETQGLATQTDVTIGGNAFVKGSVYGGSMDGHVQHDTHVTIADDCQIGAGYVAPTDDVPGHSLPKYTDWPTDASNIPTSWAECAHWPYAAPYAPYDKFATKLIDGKYYYDETDAEGNYIYAEGGAPIASDGHTWYGNVFGGGSGVIPYKPGKWHRAAGSVGGNATVDITGGHILTSVYGGNENTDVGTYTKNDEGELIVWQSGGKCTVNMTGGTLGVPRTDADAAAHPVTCYLFGAGKGDQRIFFNTWTNVQETVVNVSGTARIYGSVFGGGEDGHVLGNAAVNIGGSVTIDGTTYTADSEKLKIGTTGTSYVDGNVFGGGRGFSGEALTAGSTGGNVTMNIAGGTMLGSVYGGGRLASVGVDFTPATSPLYGLLVDDTNDKTHGHISINISGGTIGNGTTESGAGHPVSGNVFGGSMGRITLLNGTLNPLWPKMAVVKLTEVTVSGGTIYNSVYGGSEFGIVRNRAKVNVSGTADIRGNVFGGGYGSDEQDKTTITTGGYDDIPSKDYTFTPMIWTGCVSGDTEVNISGGKIGKNVYGGGDMASVGLINYNSNEAEAGTVYNYIIKHDITDGFGLSWPYKFEYIAAAPTDLPAIGGKAVGGKATVTITGGRIGSTTGTGNVFGGSKGMVSLYKEDNTTLITDVNEQRYAEAFCANVRETEVNINYASTPESDDGSTTECIVGAVYGGGQDGHVYEDAKVTITQGLIGLSVYGGGQGESTFLGKLRDQSTKNWKDKTEPVHSITAGKVYGNASVTMSGGHVIGHVYGGGNLASVGKGNYASGADDYYPAGYGEKLTGNLWDNDSNNSKAFLNSGNVTVSITGGQVGTLNGTSGTVFGTSEVTPTGMVFGGSRGRSAQDVMLDPRHEYAPDFYLGYVNTTSVTIGNASGGPRIFSQVFGGGRDGHVRNSAHVTVNNGIIGQTYAETSDDYQRYHRGNVYGSGSGLGMWDTVHHGMSSGSVTRNTTVDINGGTIYNNVYGGGALSSVGPPKLDPEKDYAASTWSKCVVNINGGTIGDPTYYESNKYGGCVYGASRGNDFAAGESTKDFATVLWTDVNITGGSIAGNVYGGGATGDVKCNTDVSMTGGTVGHDVFGGGKGDGTLFDCSKAMVGIEGDGAGADLTTDENKVKGTSVTISNGTVNGNVYGGGEVGRVEWNTQVTVGAVSGSGTPKVEGSVFGAGKGLETHGYSALVRGNSTVTVQGAAKIGHNVYGGGEMATVGRYWVKGRNTTDPNTGKPFDDAKPIPEDLPDGMPYKQQSGGICSVTIRGNADIGYNGAADNAGHVFGAGQGVVPHFSDGPKPQKKVDDGVLVDFADEAAYFEFLETLALVTNANVTVDGSAQVQGNVYGGSESGFVQHDTYVTIQDGTIGKSGSTTYGKVFGGGKGLSLSSTTFSEAGKVKDNTTVNILGGTVYSDVYGGGALGKSNTAVDNNAYPTATVNLLGGIIEGDAYGGGLGDADTNTAADVGNTVVNLNGIDKSSYDAADPTMQAVFDGLVNTEGATTYPLKTSLKGCIVDEVFGANNVKGTPLGHVKVHVFATQNKDAAKTTITAKFANDNINLTNITVSELKGMLADLIREATVIKIETDTYQATYNNGSATADDVKSAINGLNEAIKSEISDENTPTADIAALNALIYDVKAVYGGGNQADYLPISTNEYAEVIIDGCSLTSIENVYGGGNAAAVPATDVKINGCYMIDNVFGGGNGTVQAANVGYSGYLGTAKTNLSGGYIHKVFGGSNTNGNILHGSFVTSEKTSAESCDLKVSEVFGGGNVAPMQGGTEVVLGCMPNDWIDEIYAGAQDADVTGDVMLTITSGKFGRVFGGNKSGGKLDGGIVVNIEENPTCDTPIVIGELYGGGNEAPYSAYGYNADGTGKTKDEVAQGRSASPVVVHAKAFTSIGKIFGGGKGSAATLIGNPWVLVDEMAFDKTASGYKSNAYDPAADTGKPSWIGDGADQVKLYSHEDGKMGVVGTIFGGGNEASVQGNTTVKIASYDYVVFWSAPELDDVTGFYTRSGEGTPASPYVYTEATGAPTPGAIYYKKVAGADIRGNIYGGGNNAEVTGDTNVVIGRKEL